MSDGEGAMDPTTLVDTPMGVAVLSANPDDGPLKVRGVALSENDVTYGESGTRKFWSRDVIEPAVEGLVGTKIVDDRQHEIPDDGDISDLPKQPSLDSIVGEITDAKYEPGLGAVYEGEIDDPNVAALVQNGRVDVSPFIFHGMGDPDENDVAPVKSIQHWRDLAVVSEGAGSNASIDPVDDEPDVEVESTTEPSASGSPSDPQPAAAAMSAAALSAVLDTSFDDSVKSNEPAPPEETEVETDAETDADPEPETDPEADADVDDDVDESVPESESEGSDAATETETDESASDELAESSAEGGSDIPDSTMELTEAEEKFVNKARALDNPTVVEADVEALADTANDLEIEQYDEPAVIEAEEFDEPKVVETTEFDQLSERVELIEDFMAARLAERTGVKEETAGALSLNALFDEFTDEDGEFDAEALVQNPVSGDAGGDNASPDANENSAEALAQKEEQNEELETEIAALQQKRDVLGNTSVAGRLDAKIEALEAKKEDL